MISVSKIGSDHIGANKNNQDYFFVSKDGKVKVIMDGCGSGEFSEIGPRLLNLALSQVDEINSENFEIVIEEIFSKVKTAMSFIYKDVTSVLYNTFTFTILAVFEEEDNYTVLTCGDGYIITQDKDGLVLFNETEEVVKDDMDEYPKYYIYNYVDKDKLKLYQDGTTFTRHVYPKDKYVNVGVATDGLRYWRSLNQEEGEKFIQLLKKGKKGPLSRYITSFNEKRYNADGTLKGVQVFKDDITIVF